MQILLTEAEYDELLDTKKQTTKADVKKLQEFCTRVADELPVLWEGWVTKTVKEPWGCILTPERDHHEWYCDSCPAQGVCPNPHKSWSK